MIHYRYSAGFANFVLSDAVQVVLTLSLNDGVDNREKAVSALKELRQYALSLAACSRSVFSSLNSSHSIV